MNILLWIVQGLLAVAFSMAGIMKVSKSKDELKSKVGGWVEDFSSTQIKLIGILEVIGAIGIVLPMGINIMPVLTPVAAAGLGLTMIGAMLLHLKRKEFKSILPNAFLLMLSTFVVLGRFFFLPIT